MLGWLAQSIGEAAFKAGESAARSVEWRFLFLGSLACGLVVWFVASAFGVPAEPGFNGSILCGPSPGLAMIVVAVALAVSVIPAVVAMLLIVDEAGLVCVCGGLGALAIRSGSMRSVLQNATGSSVFLALIIESIILFAFVLVTWIGLRLMLGRFRGKPVAELSTIAPNEDAASTWATKFSTLAIQVVVMAICEIVLMQTDAKPQALASVGIAGFVGSFAAYAFFAALPEGICYWAGPSVLAVLAYVLAMFNPGGLGIGEVHGWASSLARATPLDYASIGTAAAILGHWSARRQAQPETEVAPEESPTDAPQPSVSV